MPNYSVCPLYALVAVSALVAQGCEKHSAKRSTDKAEAVVEAFLDAWSRGESPDKFADPNRPLQGADPDWQAGCRLVSFLSVEATQRQDSPDHVRCRVALSLQDPKGKKLDKEVVYDVRVGERSVIGRVSRKE